VEFVLVGVLLTALFCALLQFGFALHVRNTLQACASEGARHGANLGLGPADAARRTEQLIASSLSPRYTSGQNGSVSAAVEPLDGSGVPVVVVRVRAQLPVIAGLVPVVRLDLEGRALQELP
jgi:Flp pilus assembly protein TadG